MKLSYANESEMNNIIQQQEANGYRLSEIRNVKEGNFLVFEKNEPSIEERIAATEEAINALLGL